MEFRDRTPKYPGRVKLIPVSGQADVYDMTLQDNASMSGTALNAATFDAFRQELIEYVNANPGAQGEKGEKGEPGEVIDKKTFLVGSNSGDCKGWYKLGSVDFSNRVYFDYHAKILITATFERQTGVTMPSGLLTVDIRYGNTGWENCFVKWNALRGANPDYICYTLIDKKFTLYGYIPDCFDFYRIDILGESNRDVYDVLFKPVVEYGGVSQVRERISAPSSAKYPVRNYLKFYEWKQEGIISSDAIFTCSQTVHGLLEVAGAVVCPISIAKSTDDLSYYDKITTGNVRCGVTIDGTTVYVALDDGVFVNGFYCLIYGR